MRPKMTACPNPLQWVPVSTTAKPVTDTADVAVNRASSNEVDWPDAVAAGNNNSTVPNAMVATKPVTTVRAGWFSSGRRPSGRRPNTRRPQVPAIGVTVVGRASSAVPG
jgi:hypothetical protein